jgi:hypothetical protein
VTHLLYELHTPFVNTQEAACEDSTAFGDPSAPYELAMEVLEASATLVRVLDGAPREVTQALRLPVAEGLHEVERAIGVIER